MISSLCFIPKGVAKAEPEQTTLTDEELAALKAAAGQEGAEVMRGWGNLLLSANVRPLGRLS